MTYLTSLAGGQKISVETGEDFECQGVFFRPVRLLLLFHKDKLHNSPNGGRSGNCLHLMVMAESSGSPET